MIKETMHQEDTILINIYAPIQGAPKIYKPITNITKERKRQKHYDSRGSKYPLLDMDRSSKQKINKIITSLNDILNQLDIIDIYRVFHSKTVAYTFFSSAHGTFSRIDRILGYRDILNKYKRFEIIPTIFSYHNVLKLEIN
uniref:Uncharacterized protein n=1 Tax=Rousettus aegyptiacus TaxID=9407 RepID=A0A7J8EKG9_ROUAE|nr:hypothetical protein HJG63_012544 [Rousettus aegyptiacus]